MSLKSVDHKVQSLSRGELQSYTKESQLNNIYIQLLMKIKLT